MKWTLLSFLILFIFSAPYTAGATADIQSNSGKKKLVTINKERKAGYQTLKRTMELQLGRKLKWTERLGLRAVSMLPEKDDARKANNHALVGFILGVSSLVLLPLLSIPGFIFSSSALTKEKQNPGILEGGNKGLAKAGLILSIIGFVYLLLVILYIVLVISSGFFI